MTGIRAVSLESVQRDRYRVASGCLDCAGDLAGALLALPGCQEVQVLGAAGVVVIGHDGTVTPEEVARQASRNGLDLAPADQIAQPAGKRSPWWRSPRVLLLVTAELLLDAGLAADHLAGQHALATWFYLATVATGGIFPARAAWQVLKGRRLSIGTLLVAGTIGALALGVFAEAAMLVVVFSAGGLMEDFVADKARSSIRALMSLTPPLAALLQPDGTAAPVAVADLRPGDLILVRPGERMPTDGQVTAGYSWIDQSPLASRSCPIASRTERISLPYPDNLDHHFVVDPTKFDFYAMVCLLRCGGCGASAHRGDKGCCGSSALTGPA